MNKRLDTLPIVVTIQILPGVNGKARVDVVHGELSDGNQETYYKGKDEALLIHALRDARSNHPKAKVVWVGWKQYSELAFENHVASNLCPNFEEHVFFEGDSGIPVHELIVR